MAEQTGFVRTVWQTARPDILSAWRDFLILVNLLGIIALVQLAFFSLSLLHLDPELLVILMFLHKWVTVLVFAAFLYTVALRALFVAFRKGKGD
jgi:hypothetical protein